MWGDFGGPDVQPDVPTVGDVPTQLDVLPDGQQVLVEGNPQGDAAFNHQQGDNTNGYQEDCGLVSSQDVLNQFGVPVTETDVVQYAAQHGLCDTSGSPSDCGGTSADTQAQLLTDYGVPAHAAHGGLADVAAEIEQGHGVIIEANAGVLWQDANYYDTGQANHAVTVTGVARDPQSGQIVGFYINDSGNGQSAEFIPADQMQQAWADTGGTYVATDVARSDAVPA